MSEGKRPGGLTALAVLNLLGCGYDFLTAFGFAILWAQINFPDFAAMIPMDEDGKRVLDAMREIGNGVLYTLIAVHVVLALLLLLSGIGYLLQKRFLGRTLGNVYALVSLATTAVMMLALQSEEAGGGFQLITLVLILYPALTLLLLNTTFKEDFVH